MQVCFYLNPNPNAFTSVHAEYITLTINKCNFVRQKTRVLCECGQCFNDKGFLDRAFFLCKSNTMYFLK